MPILPTRRRILETLSLAGAAGLAARPRPLRAEEALETTSVRIGRSPAICIAPQYLAEPMLRAEGFTDIRYVEEPPGATDPLAHGKVDFDTNYASNFVRAIDAGAPITLLAGVMVGCFELFGSEKVRSIGDLKGKTVGIQALGSNPHSLVSLMVALVGLDPVNDIRWLTDPKVKPIERFIAGEIDAFLGFPPEPQELRARHVGHVLVSTAVDRPWSQYFCCLLGANPDYVRAHPVATRRVLRAILKATDLCADDPPGAARRLVDGGYTPFYDYAAEALHDNPYDKWRDYDAEDTVRFYALRLGDAGFIKSSPQKILANADWRYLDELKRELKS